jgi:hypothetical protein
MLQWSPVYPSPRIRKATQLLERGLSAKWFYAYRGYCDVKQSFPSEALATLFALRHNPHIIIRPADKNMGLCIVKRDWYVQTCLSHLQSTRDFVEIPAVAVDQAVRNATCRFTRLLEELSVWIKHPLIHVSRLRLLSHRKYLLGMQRQEYRLPCFYGLIKVHKSPVALRPIIACHSWVTTTLSQICAHELHRLIRQHLPHVLRDSKQLIQMLESANIPLTFPPSSLRLITGDVEGLYVNIPVGEAIDAVTRFCDKHKGPYFAAMVSSWLKFVFEEALVVFGERTFRQIWGFPMGTALSPDAANTFMALCEDVQGVYNHEALDTFLPQPECLLLFARLIDDYTILLGGVDDEDTTRFLHELDSRVAPHLRITWKVSQRSMDTLDLHVFTGSRLRTGKLDYRTHQKLGNRYTFLPFSSLHSVWTKKAVIKAEVTRHATNCSSFAWFQHMVSRDAQIALYSAIALYFQ